MQSGTLDSGTTTGVAKSRFPKRTRTSRLPSMFSPALTFTILCPHIHRAGKARRSVLDIYTHVRMEAVHRATHVAFSPHPLLTHLESVPAEHSERERRRRTTDHRDIPEHLFDVSLASGEENAFLLSRRTFQFQNNAAGPFITMRKKRSSQRPGHSIRALPISL